MKHKIMRNNFTELPNTVTKKIRKLTIYSMNS